MQADVCAPFLACPEAGVPATVAGGPTLADGIAVKRPTGITVDLIRRHVDEIVAVGENEIADAIVMLLMRSKLVVEGAGAVGAAALIDGRVTPPAAGTTVVVLSGGNIDTGLLSPVIRRHETNAGRRVVLFARISDRPGNLARLLTCIGLSGGNLVTVEHLREGYDLHVRETAVHIVLETRNREQCEGGVGRSQLPGLRRASGQSRCQFDAWRHRGGPAASLQSEFAVPNGRRTA